MWQLIGNWFKRSSGDKAAASGAQLSPSEPQGPWTGVYATYIPRKVSAAFYEIMRESVPFIDAGINRLTSLEGRIDIEGDNAALVEELKEWMYNVPVNGFMKGLQSFHQVLTSEAFEQGFAVGEFVADASRSDIVGLNVADSKTIFFKRKGQGPGVHIYQTPGLNYVEKALRPDNLIHFVVHPDNMNPYGTSLLRSCEFAAKTFTTINAAMQNNWKRWGDPSLHAHYKSATAKDETSLEKIRKAIATDLSTAFRAKSAGGSADLVTAGNLESEVIIKVIGADGQTLEIEQPMRHVLEQVVSKFGLAPWMLGLHWSTTERLSDAEVEVVLSDIRSRQEAKGPMFYNLFRTLLLLRGRTWKPGDWRIVWKQVNLHDELKQAQAGFLRAQTDMMRADAGGRSDTETGKSGRKSETAYTCRCGGHHGAKEVQRTEAWPELDQVEDAAEESLKGSWAELQDRVLQILKLSPLKAAGHKGVLPDGLPPLDAFTFSEEQRAQIFKAMGDFVGEFRPDKADSPLAWYYARSFELGTLKAAQMNGKERPIIDTIQNSQTLKKLSSDGFSMVKNDATKSIQKKIIPAIETMALTGENPIHVARKLRKEFGDANADWERLARTEFSIAAETAKVEEWKAEGVETSGAVIAGRDTHPRCRCANTIKLIGGKAVVSFSPAPDACNTCMALAGPVS